MGERCAGSSVPSPPAALLQAPSLPHEPPLHAGPPRIKGSFGVCPPPRSQTRRRPGDPCPAGCPAGHGTAAAAAPRRAAPRRPSPFLVRQRQPPTEGKFPAESQDRFELSSAPKPPPRRLAGPGPVLSQPRPGAPPAPAVGAAAGLSPSCTAWKGLLASMSLME